MFRHVICCLLFLVLSGCQFRYADSYTGQYDPNRNFKSEGFVTALYSVLVIGKPEDPTQSRPPIRDRSNLRCASGDQVNWRMLDTIEWDLRREFSRDFLDIENRKDIVLVHLPGEKYYGVGEEHVSSDFYPVLDRLTARLRQYKHIRIELIGHADSTDTNEFNQSLSEYRADNLERYLNRYQVKPEVTISTGRGELDPRVSNSTVQGRALNRRVTLLICSVAA